MSNDGGNVRKMIVINKPLSHEKSRRNKNHGTGSTSKVKPNSMVRPNTLKRALLDRIKSHQKRVQQHREDGGHIPLPTNNSNANNSDNVQSNESFSNDFNESMEFLRQLSNKRREQRHRRHTMKKQELHVMQQPQSQPQPFMASPISTPMPMQMPTPTPMPMQMQMPAPMPMPIPTMSVTPVISAQPIQQISDLQMIDLNVPPSMPMPPPATTTDEQSESDSEPSEPSAPPPEPPSIFIKQEPPHGCLKKGNKPTFREWAKKALQRPVDALNRLFVNDQEEPESASSDGDENDPDDNGPKENLISTTGMTKEETERAIQDNPNITGIRMKIRQTTTKKFRVGKHGKVVGVLLKNRQTQRHIQNEHHSLRQKSLGDIKKYLYDKNLLRVGSNAPPDVIRRMYEDSILAGDVNNVGKGVVLHNFMSGNH
jgi:hypothetical protein